jgi:hypothetical protein
MPHSPMPHALIPRRRTEHPLMPRPPIQSSPHPPLEFIAAERARLAREIAAERKEAERIRQEAEEQSRAARLRQEEAAAERAEVPSPSPSPCALVLLHSVPCSALLCPFCSLRRQKDSSADIYRSLCCALCRGVERATVDPSLTRPRHMHTHTRALSFLVFRRRNSRANTNTPISHTHTLSFFS